MWRKRFTTVATSSSSSIRALKEKKWDAVVIGGGHNGLTAAAYLARAGLSVAVLERRHIVGGASVTEEIIPGFKELQLERHGLKMLNGSSSSFTPCVDGRYLFQGMDEEENLAEISKFSKRDAEAYPRYEKQLEEFCKFLDPILDSIPPESLHGVSSLSGRFKDQKHKLDFWVPLFRRAISLGQKDLVDFVELLLSPASKVLHKWFETDVLKGSLGMDSIIGSTVSKAIAPLMLECSLELLTESMNHIMQGSPATPGSGYVLLHHVMGDSDGDRNIWSHVEGGMGSISSAIRSAAVEAGANVVTNAEVSEMLLNDSGAVNGVLLADGTKVVSRVVLSNATPYKTFLEMLPSDVLPVDFTSSVKNADYNSATTKINVALDKLPQFECRELSGSDVGTHHMGTIRIGGESLEAIEKACQDAENGLPSQRPAMEMTIPSVLDKTISPTGKHVVGLFTQYTPYKPCDGSWDDPTYREMYAKRCFNLIDEYAPGFSSSIIGYDMLTPPDLEREIGLTGGNIFHGAMGLDSLFLMRPVKGWSDYRTPIEGLYLCGSGAHPGGGVMGAPGRNSARVVLQDLNKST
ncbi:Pyridine nucleotide-disulfide oxidoreductase domain-containing protein 2 [Linum perenne]